MVSKHSLKLNNTWSAEIAENPRRTRNLFRSDPESIQNRTRVDPRPHRSDLGTTWKRRSSKVLFLKKKDPKGTPFGIDFVSFHCMKLTKQGFGGIATTRAHVKKVAFPSGRYWKYSEKVSSPCEWRNRAIGNLLVQN